MAADLFGLLCSECRIVRAAREGSLGRKTWHAVANGSRSAALCPPLASGTSVLSGYIPARAEKVLRGLKGVVKFIGHAAMACTQPAHSECPSLIELPQVGNHATPCVRACDCPQGRRMMWGKFTRLPAPVESCMLVSGQPSPT